MQLNIETVEPRLFAGVIADEIIACINDSIAERGSCSVVLAGGSTPAGVYRLLSRPPRAGEVSWDKVRLYLGDERWVLSDDNQSNFKMVDETLLTPLQKSKPQVMRVKTELSSPQASAEDYEQAIRKNEQVGSSDFPTFDLVLLGMGEDGHTASLFPHSPVIQSASNKICVAAENTNMPAGSRTGRERVSLTVAALTNCRRMLFMVSGENKALVLRRVLEGSDAISELPSRLYTQAKHRVTWFVDTGAAKELTNR